jgi:hypothetical protein
MSEVSAFTTESTESTVSSTTARQDGYIDFA